MAQVEVSIRDRIYHYVVAYKRQNDGLSPPFREIARAVGLLSVSSVHYHLSLLEKEGLVHVKKRRGIQISGGQWLPPN